MALTFVQGVSSTLITNTTQTATFGTNTTGGSLLIVYALTNGGFLTIADSRSNTWVKLYTDSSDASISMWYAVNKAGGGADTITVTQTGSSAIQISALEFTGQSAVPFDDYIDGQTGAGTSVSIGPLSTNFSNEILLCVWANSTTPSGHSPGLGWTACYADNDSYLAAMYQSQTAKGSYTALATTASGGYMAGGLIAIKGTNSSSGGGASSSWLTVDLANSLRGLKH